MIRDVCRAMDVLVTDVLNSWTGRELTARIYQGRAGKGINQFQYFSESVLNTHSVLPGHDVGCIEVLSVAI